MDNQQVLDLFVGRGMVDTALAQDILSEIESSGKEVASISEIGQMGPNGFRQCR